VKKQHERSMAYKNAARFKKNTTFRKGCIELFQQINEESFKYMRRKV
jgi:hypothetical protein